MEDTRNETFFLASACVCLHFFAHSPRADEGMWLYNAPPKDKIKAKYGFELTQQWLDHVRLSSVRFNNGGSGSFVSADGLTFTNHHVGAGCVQQLSTEGHDYIKTGFYAKTQAEEAKCPNLELNQLVGIEDVTDKVNAGVKPGMSAAEAGQAQRAAMSQVEKDCSAYDRTALRCSDSSIRARFITSTSTRSTPMCVWCSRRNSTSPSSAAIPITLPIRATIWTSLFSESTKMANRRTSTIICSGRAPA